MSYKISKDCMEQDLETNQLFVSGTPQDCTEEEILQFFSWFGNIIGVKLLKTGISRCKSFLVTPEKNEFLHKILGTKNLVYRNRFLHCKMYENKKPNLRNQLLNANTRRVILKKVPSQISEEKVKILVEKFAGEIEMIFAYRPETADQDHLHMLRKFRTYSVLFRSSAAAERLLQLGHITLDEQFNHPIIIEKFFFRGKKVQVPVRSQSQSKIKEVEEKMFLERAESYNEFGLNSLHRKGPYKDLTMKLKRSTVTTKASPSINEKHIKYQRIDINASIHLAKPTSKKYYEMHKRFCAQPESGLQIRLFPLRS